MSMVSIVIPFYNNPELLTEMVKSVKKQSYQNWELLLIDDGADSDTIYQAELLKSSDHRIKIIKRNRSPKGAQACRNIGLQNAIGDFICFFDSDDIVLPNCLARRVKFLEERRDIDFAVFKAQTYDAKDKFHVNFFGSRQTSDDLKYFILGILPFAVWTNMYRRESLIKCGALWDEKILSLQDSAFNIQNITINNLKYTFYNSKEPDYFWRINHNNNSITKKIQSKEHNKSHLYFIKTITDNIKEKFDKKYDKYISLRIYDFCLRFINNGDFESVKSMQQIAYSYNIGFPNIKLLNFYSYLRNKISVNKLDKLFRYLLFPTYTYQIRRNAILF